MRYYKIIIFAFLLLITVTACRPKVSVPKPKAYFKIELPRHEYRLFDSSFFPFQFEYPVYGEITQDVELAKKENSPYWINVHFKDMDATIYLSYKAITYEEPLNRLINESYKLSSSHNVRADYIKSTPEFITPNGLTAVYYTVGGNAASAFQFYITDNNKHFTRGSLYFNVTPNADSLRPAQEFLRKDMEHLVETMRFK